MKKLVLKKEIIEAMSSIDSSKIQGGGKSAIKDCTARPTLTGPTNISHLPMTEGGCPTWMTCPDQR